jgi:uncharacterized membrane protein HdeD (DUF308 family)
MQVRLFLVRGVVAIAWAVVFVMVSDSLTTGVRVLLVLYPVIDVVGSVIDARGQQGSTRRLLELNTAISVAAAVALGIAGSGDKGDVLAVFGVWALITGGLQLAVAIRRRMVLGRQWPLLLAGAGSTLFGIAFLAMAGMDNPPLRMIAAYAFGGGLEFVSRPGCSRAGHLGPSRRPRVVGITVAVAASRAYGHCITRRAVVRVRRDLRRGLQRGHSKVLGGLAAGEHGDVV